MAHNLNSSKRKFHKLLDSLTNNKSSPSLPLKHRDINDSSDVPSIDLEPATKRPRTSLESYRSSTKFRPSSSGSLKLLPTSKTSSAGTVPSPAQQPKVPNYAPWDRQQFLQRLKTFRHVDKWGSKPFSINEVQWARRGWTCVGKERVGCIGGCGREVVVKLDSYRKESEEDTEQEDQDDWTAAADLELIERYSSMIITEHDESCLWRKHGCDGAIHRLPLAHPASSIASLKERYESLVGISSELPSAVSTPEEVEFTALASQLPRNFFSQSLPNLEKPESGINKCALLLALFGWQAEAGHVKGLAACEACFRRLGLWLFKSMPQSFTTDAQLADDGDNDGEASMSRLDPVREHRDYCPWINSDSQSGFNDTNKDNKSGWEILLRVIRNNEHFREESNDNTSVTILPQSDKQMTRSEGGSDKELIRDLVDEDRNVRDAKDKERWAKLRKLKRAFEIKSIKRPGRYTVVEGKENKSQAQRPSTADV